MELHGETLPDRCCIVHGLETRLIYVHCDVLTFRFPRLSLVCFRSNFQSCTFYNEPGVVSCGACGSTYVDLDAGGGAYDQFVQLSTRTPALLFLCPQVALRLSRGVVPPAPSVTAPLRHDACNATLGNPRHWAVIPALEAPLTSRCVSTLSSAEVDVILLSTSNPALNSC